LNSDCVIHFSFNLHFNIFIIFISIFYKNNQRFK
jgi:hypothetical protein